VPSTNASRGETNVTESAANPRGTGPTAGRAQAVGATECPGAAGCPGAARATEGVRIAAQAIASVQCLAFAARRLLAEPVALIFAVREPGDDQELAGMPGLTVTGLGDADARAVLATAVGGRVDAEVRDRIVAETGGNPLALLQLPRGLGPAELAGGFWLPDPRPLASRIENSFHRQFRSLPRQTHKRCHRQRVQRRGRRTRRARPISSWTGLPCTSPRGMRQELPFCGVR